LPSAVVGRDAEIALVKSVLEEVRGVPVAGGARVWGRSGIGKTSLIDAVAQYAIGSGWLVLRTECHHIQSQVPLVVTKRLVASVTTQLGDAARRYVAGLSKSGAGDDSVEETFYRLLEGLLVDYPVLLAVDDVQWIDAESERVISQALRLLADARLALVAAGRVETAEFAELGLRAVTLDRLSDAAIAEIVRTHLPAATDDVVAAVVAHSAGIPMTAAVLAKETLAANVTSPDDVPASMRTVVARSVRQMNAPRREFLQLCSLIEDPIDYRVISKLYAGQEAAVEGFMQDLIPAFLMADGPSLLFAHASIAEGVRQTIAIEIPYRRRVLKALQDIESPTLDDRERMVRQAAACGDRAIEREALVDLAHAAMAVQAVVTACDAYRRAFSIEPPPVSEFVREYFSYGSALIFIGRFDEAREVLDFALQGAIERGLRQGLGVLAGAMMRSLWYVEQGDLVDAIFDRYIGLAQDANDRAALLSTKGMFSSYKGSAEVVRDCKSQVLALSGEIDPMSLLRVYQAEAFVEMRSGNYEGSLAALAAADAYREKSHLGGSLALATTRLFVDLEQFGTDSITKYLPAIDTAASAIGQPNTYRIYLEAFGRLVAGKLDEASLLVEQALMRGRDRMAIHRALGIEAALAVMGDRPLRYEAMVVTQIRSLSGRIGDSAVSFAAWWAVGAINSNPEDARNAIDSVLPRVRAGLEPAELFLPESLAMYGERAKDLGLLEELAAWPNDGYPTPWHRAHWAMTRALANAALGRPNSRESFVTAGADLKALKADLFASLALERAGSSASPKQRPLEADASSRRARTSRPTAREVQIAKMVADGFSNRRIAEQLVLSERTVEAHLANIFAKLGVTSRVQVAGLAARGEL
jgi:DNA-binding CsgD family transcriptional regulator/tetratricopeptide (TPR) repeat protein